MLSLTFASDCKDKIVTSLIFLHTYFVVGKGGVQRKLSSQSVTLKNQVFALNDGNLPSYGLAENLKYSQIRNFTSIILPTGDFKCLSSILLSSQGLIFRPCSNEEADCMDCMDVKYWGYYSGYPRTWSIPRPPPHTLGIALFTSI